ncbi:4-hydroxythreonine-4-phosphate dehydrogenase PdxA [Halanaerobium hydrogeniformans]|uniref:4-hydroxythreonine-4-phosphate dehydrogenase n=1 Tax=Halanaerobium hydrogeniformans TaxID=656519 RepID=E4RPK4_HALHG|nr:4-hydroxythreonine-4-phosphate dehydrogenase PdxA [Halanaerobium hydrogeniformans]ADQ14027.1 4-hydroxythreonine-4-phosphate dehydrogenase [Halanaerobium hydrogeniformans]
MNKAIIAITMGDPAGIGAEIIVKALNNKDIYEKANPVVVGSSNFLKDAVNLIPSNLKINPVESVDDIKGEYGTIDVMDLENIQLSDIQYGVVDKKAGKAAVEYIFKAIELAKEKKIDAVVTGPINKEAINAAGFHYSGHTEIFAEKTETDDYAMMLADDEMKVIHVSTHVSLREACDLVKKERILTVINLADQALKSLSIKEPKIAVAGLNPHCGEQGLFGSEEAREISPAVKEAQKAGINAEGPISPDTIFSKVRGGQYDIAVVMYHDQGHIPMKVIGFQYNQKLEKWESVSGVNITVGLPIIRTSVDHGTAFEIAGEGKANQESMIEAIEMAIQFTEN